MLTTPLSPDHWYFNHTNAHQRDLLWSVFGPPLLDCAWSPAAQQPWPMSANIDLINELPLAPTYHSQRLGFKFEQLWQSWLTRCNWPFHANVQINDQQRTLGELDLLVRILSPENNDRDLETCPIHHWELALKFYLGYQHEWIGPNRRDVLAHKLHHTQHHQLALSQHPTAQAQLTTLHALPSHSQAILRGCLFQAKNPQYQAILPTDVSASHWHGFWCHQQEASTYLPSAHWFILAKDQWLSLALAPCAVDTATLLHYLKRHFMDLDIGLCVIRVLPCAVGWAEQERWFIMPNTWPQTSTNP